jgi:hypothetical protein
MKEATFLLAVQWVVGGIEVQHQLFGGCLEAGDELFDQHLVQAPRGGLIGPLLQAAQCGGAGHLAIHTHCRLHRYVVPQAAVIV